MIKVPSDISNIGRYVMKVKLDELGSYLSTVINVQEYDTREVVVENVTREIFYFIDKEYFEYLEALNVDIKVSKYTYPNVVETIDGFCIKWEYLESPYVYRVLQFPTDVWNFKELEEYLERRSLVSHHRNPEPLTKVTYD